MRRIRRRTWVVLAVQGVLAVVVVSAGILVGPRIAARLRPSLPLAPVSNQLEILTTTVDSRALGRAMSIEVWVPAGTRPDARLPVVILLPGIGGDASSWFGAVGGSGVGVAGVARDLIAAGRIPPVVIVSADIANSYGVNSSPAADGYDHGPYATYLRDELIPAVLARFPVSGSPADRYLGGYSMGAFAAVHLALRDPGSFAGVGLLSPAIFVQLPADRAWEYGADPAANDPLRLATTARVQAWRVFVADGTDDYRWILESNPVLAERLRHGGASVAEQSVPGGHEVGTWRALAGPMLEWLLGSR